MSVKYSQIFSEYDITQWGIQFDGDETAEVMDTVASCEQAMEVRTVEKKKRNLPWKKRTKPTGSGTKKITAHIKEDVYARMFGMYVEGYKEGVMVYGPICSHAVFGMTFLEEDEDGIQKLVANPNCTITNGLSKKIEANGETVAEVELEISISPDNDGIGEYAIVVVDETDKALIPNWMAKFDPEMVKASAEE